MLAKEHQQQGAGNDRITYAKEITYVVVVALLLVLYRLPFFYTQHIQEDAYITWRCAVNLANTGIYAFNIGERVSASTSHLYVFFVAFIRYITGTSFIPVVLVINTVILVCGLFLLSATLFSDLRRRLVFWILISVTPAALLISYSGMETSLVIGLVCLILYGLLGRHGWSFIYLPMALLPWARPDAVVIGSILIVGAMIMNKQLPYGMITCLIVGLISVLCFNYLYFGAFLNQTIIAKSSGMNLSFSSIIASVESVFIGRNGDGGIFAPLPTKYLAWLGWLWFLGSMVAFVFAVVRSRVNFVRCAGLLILIALALFVPLVYAVGGVVAPWYLWPSSLFGSAVIMVLAIDVTISDRQPRRWRYVLLLVVLMLSLGVGRWFLSLNWGTQERLYRGGIGEYIRQVSTPLDSIMLEPAGYIPFYSERYTYDEVGLVSPQVTEYRRKYGNNWWIRFVKDYKPTFLIERRHILEYKTLDGYMLDEQEREWFDSNYRLVRVFTYQPRDYYRHPLLLRLLELGQAVDYYLYQIQ